MPGPYPAQAVRQVGNIPSGDAATRLWGELAERPAAAPSNYGFYFAATDSEVLYQSDGSTWFAIADIGGGGGSALSIEEEGVEVDAAVAVIDFEGDDFDITEPTDHEVKVDISAAIARVADVVGNSLFDANTILKADSDNTPEALAVAEERLLGRITGGEITGLTQAQIRTFLGISAFGATILDDADAAAARATIDALQDNAFATWVPTWANITIGDGVIEYALYREVGEMVEFMLHFITGSTTVWTSTPPTFTLPVTAHSMYASSARIALGFSYIRDVGATYYGGTLSIESSTTATIRLLNAASTYTTFFTAIRDTLPMTWVDGDGFSVHGIYRKA